MASLTLFNATTAANGTEPWVTDGTAAGTMLLRDLSAGIVSIGSYPSEYTRLDGAGASRALFTTRAISAFPDTLDLWVTDGTAAGTTALATVGSRLPRYAAAPLGNGRAVFEVTMPGLGSAIWVSDGTAGGTARLRTSYTGVDANGAGPLVSVGAGRAMFTEPAGLSGRQLWTTDGTEAGTVPVAGVVGTLRDLVPLGDGRALFVSGQGGTGDRLWITDGTAAGTVVVSNTAPDYGSLAAVGDGRFIFTVRGPFSSQFQFSTPGYTYALWTTDGTASGTVRFRESALPLVNPPSGFTPIGNGQVVYQTTEGRQSQQDSDILVTDGTAFSNFRLATITAPSGAASPSSFTALGGGRFVFQATDDTHGAELWASDGISSAELLRDINPGAAGSGIKGLTAIADGRAVFQATGAAGAELWVTDGTAAGTALLRDIAAGPDSSNPTDFAPLTPVTLSLAPVVVRLFPDTYDKPGNQAYVGAYDLFGGDTVYFIEGRRGAAITVDGGTVTVTHAGQTDTLRGISTLQFADGRVTFDVNDRAAQVTRLYQAAFGRAPEQGGLNYWIGSLQTDPSRLRSSATLADVADFFLSSPEFTSRYGSALGNEAFVTRIYQNVLGRDPDAGGLQYWTDVLDGGAFTRARALAAISESDENKARTAPVVQAGIWDRSESAPSVVRMYDTVFGRLPDVGGLAFWAPRLDGGVQSLFYLAEFCITSAEFAATYGALDNQAFVERVYGNTQGRAGDAPGVEYWTNRLNTGTLRASFAATFSETTGHAALTAMDFGGEMPESYGVRLA